MQLFIACSAFALSIAVAVKRPSLSATRRVSPAAAALAGVVCLLLAGSVHPADLVTAAEMLWRPLVTIFSILVTTLAAERTGTVDAMATRVLGRRATSARALFPTVFMLSLATATVLSNDAAIILLTPLVVTFVRIQFPSQPRLLLPFGFAVFMAAGVAPLITSNPMNIVVASAVGLNFNQYAATMLPIAAAGSLVTYVCLRRLFSAELASGVVEQHLIRPPATFGRMQKRLLMVLFGVAGTYPLVSGLAGSAIWIVAAAGAAAAVWLAARDQQMSPVALLRQGGGMWDVLVFLPAVFVLTIGLRNAGLTDLLASWYQGASLGVVGVTAAVGSAVLNNHPMAFINLMALDPSGGDVRLFLAALIGGDLGPRLVPTGSLAGLLWLEACRRLDVHVTPLEFMRVGALLTLPTLLVSLLLLALI
jgi:arsenical pump membrane protein